MATGLKGEGASAAAMRRLEGMLQIRRFEEQVLRMGAAGAFPGHYHVYIGQEPTAIAVSERLLPEDLIFTTWRNHGICLRAAQARTDCSRKSSAASTACAVARAERCTSRR
jgi:pyruvate dehydrogenase E1 component alpha subunit